jgi:hypothetical protein
MEFRMDVPPWLETVVLIAGIGQLGIVVGSLKIPSVLGWKQDVARLRPLTRQVFWTYAGYIWATNLSFALISILAPESLVDGSPLAGSVTGFIALYWGARVVIQFTWFDRSDAPEGTIYRLAEVVLVSLFVFFTVTYGYAAVLNLWGTPA